MTAFKRPRFLSEAIESALRQTVPDFELIVTDDSNSPELRAICERYLSDGRVRYRANTAVMGIPANISAAMDEAKGEYASILNDDDVMEPFMLEALLAPLRADPAGILCFGDHWVMDESGALLKDLTEWNSAVNGRASLKQGLLADPFPFALQGGIPLVMGALFRRSAYVKEWLTPEVAGSYDQWLAIRFSRQAGAIHYVKERVTKYRAHGASETARLDPEKAHCDVYVWDRLLAERMEPRERNIVRKRLARYLFILGRDRLKFGQTGKARHAFRRSLQNEFKYPALAGLMLAHLPGRFYSPLLRVYRKLRGLARCASR